MASPEPADPILSRHQQTIQQCIGVYQNTMKAIDDIRLGMASQMKEIIDTHNAEIGRLEGQKAPEYPDENPLDTDVPGEEAIPAE